MFGVLLLLNLSSEYSLDNIFHNFIVVSFSWDGESSTLSPFQTVHMRHGALDGTLTLGLKISGGTLYIKRDRTTK